MGSSKSFINDHPISHAFPRGHFPPSSQGHCLTPIDQKHHAFAHHLMTAPLVGVKPKTQSLLPNLHVVRSPTILVPCICSHRTSPSPVILSSVASDIPGMLPYLADLTVPFCPQRAMPKVAARRPHLLPGQCGQLRSGGGLPSSSFLSRTRQPLKNYTRLSLLKMSFSLPQEERI